MYKRAPLTVVNDTYTHFNVICNLRRGASKSMKALEMRFAAQVTKFNSTCKYNKNSRMSHSNPFIIQLTCRWLTESVNIGNSVPLIGLIGKGPYQRRLSRAVTYEWISYVIRQCDKQKYDANLQGNYSSTVRRNVRGPETYNQHTNNGRYDPTLQKPCRRCNKYGHWSKQHLSDVSLPHGVRNIDKSTYANGNIRNKNYKQSRNNPARSKSGIFQQQ